MPYVQQLKQINNIQVQSIKKMRKQEFISSIQLKLNLLSMQKKMTQLRHRYVIEIITDNHVEQVKKTFRQFQYFNKILHKKIGLSDKLLHLSKHFRSNNDYKDLQLFINRLNQGYLLYRSKRQLDARRNAEVNAITENGKLQVLQLQPVKTRQLRGYLYDLLFKQDQLFIDGVDDDSNDEDQQPKVQLVQSETLKAEFKKEESYELSSDEKGKPSRNPIKRLFQSVHDKAFDKVASNQVGGKALNQIQRAQVNITQIVKGQPMPRQKSNEAGKLRRAFLHLTNKTKNVGKSGICENYSQSKNMKQILKGITKCWIKFPYNYQTRDRTKIYKPYIWQQYDIKLYENKIQFINLKNQHRHRKVFVIFQSDVELNFDDYTKLIIKNKVDKNPLEIRLAIDEDGPQITEQYLALYTYIKQSVKQQQQKLKALFPSQKGSKVCNKVRVRINLKPIIQRTASYDSLNNIVSQFHSLGKSRGSELKINIPHIEQKGDQKQIFQFKQNKQFNENLKNVSVKIVHSSINATVSVSLDFYVDVDFPILDNFGSLDIYVIDMERQTGFLPNLGSKQALYSFNIPVQTIYDYIYNLDMPKKRRSAQMKTKMIQIKHTKVNLSLDYKCIGNTTALCSYNKNDIFEQDEPPQQFNRDQFRMNNNRLKRIIWSIQLYTDKLKDLKNFTYPNLSYLFYCMLALACLVFDMNNMLFWFLVFVLSILFYNSPAYSVYIRDIVDFLKLKAKKNKLDVFLFKKSPIIEQQYVVPMKKTAKMLFLQQFQLTRKIKRSIYKKYKRILQVLLQAQIMLTKIVSIIQKIKNLFIWYHYRKTKLLFWIIAGMIFVLMVLPMRLILFLGVLKMMKKGSKYHTNIQDMNKVIIIQLIRIIIRQNNLTTMSLYFKQHYRPVNFQSPDASPFVRLCATELSNWLQITINMQQIMRKSKNMSQFIINLSKCKTKYQIRKQICQKFGFSLQWSQTQSSLQKYFNYLYGFIINIPSDKYIMGVKTVSGNDDEEVEEAENIIDRELLNF